MAIYDCTPDGGNGGGITLQSIVITTPPNTTTYTAGQVFDNTGMVVTAYYDFGLSEEITGYTVSPSGALTGDITEITINYSDGGVIRSATYPITVTRNTATLIIDPTTISLDADTQTATAQVSYNGDGELSIVNSNPEIVSADLSGATLTVNSLVDTSQTVTITINAPQTGIYTAVSTTLTVNNYVTVQIYGAIWDGSADPAWSRTDGAELFGDPQPAVNNGTGSSPFDTIMPWAGMTRVSDPVAGELVQIPKFWYKWTRSGASMQLQIANGPVDGFYVSPAHADRGDGQGERDVVYVGRYHCGENSGYKSITGVMPQGNINIETFRSNIKNLGLGYYQIDYAMWWTICMLYIVEFANWNSQEMIGYGGSKLGNGIPSIMGDTDAMLYHTGTSASSRQEYGSIQYRNIEGLWSEAYDFCDGVYFSGNSVYCIKNPEQFSNGNNGAFILNKQYFSGYISSYFQNPNISGFEYFLFPSAKQGSGNTYICDSANTGNTGNIIVLGGGSSQNLNCGLFFLYAYNYDAFFNTLSSRIQKLPNAT